MRPPSTSTSQNQLKQLTRLNAPQREAVLHGEGPLLILAGAGSGKTSTMAYRMVHLIAQRQVPMDAVLGLSFTNKAARELKERVQKLLAASGVKPPRAPRGITIPKAQRGPRGPVVTTFHSLCVRMLREHGSRIGYRPSFTIIDRSDQREILRQIFKNVRIDERKFDLDRILFEIGQAKNKFLSPESAEEQFDSYFIAERKLSIDYTHAVVASYPKYQEQLRALDAMDFDDLLFQAVELLNGHSDVRDVYNRRFQYLLVDEYQDTNPAQFKLLRLLTHAHQNICVVGDDDQSIYSWRGADPAHILEFGHHFKGARTITLDQNYRSTSTILDAANAVIKNNRARHPKSLWSDRAEGDLLREVVLEDDRTEADWVAEELARLKAGAAAGGGDAASPRNYRDFAILYRSNAQSRLFEEGLRRLKIPYKIVGGMSFLDYKEVKDVLSFWRLIANPSDDASLRRVVAMTGSGIGKASLETLANAAFEKNLSLFEAFRQLAPTLAPRSATKIAEFVALIDSERAKLWETPADPERMSGWARGSLNALQIQKVLEAEEDDPAQVARRKENIDELVHAIGQTRFDNPIAPSTAEPTADGSLAAIQDPVSLQYLREYLSTMALRDTEDDSSSESDEDADAVTILTLHGAKGLEFPVVFLVGLEDGLLPHKRTLEEGTDLGEERRLCYVGITRAKDSLIMTRARTRIRYGKAVPRNRSRFMAEIPEKLLLFQNESLGTPDVHSQKAVEAHEAQVQQFMSGISSLKEMLAKNKKS